MKRQSRDPRISWDQRPQCTGTTTQIFVRPPEPPSSPLTQNNNGGESSSERILFVPTRKVGYLVGYQGRTIRTFEEATGTKIDILKPRSAEEETPVSLVGKEQGVSQGIK